MLVTSPFLSLVSLLYSRNHGWDFHNAEISATASPTVRYTPFSPKESSVLDWCNFSITLPTGFANTSYMRKGLITLQTDKFNRVTVKWNWFRDNLTWKDLFSSIFLSSRTKSMPLVSMAVTAEKRMKRFVSVGIVGCHNYLVLEPASPTFLMIILRLQSFPHVKTVSNVKTTLRDMNDLTISLQYYRYTIRASIILIVFQN